MQGAQNAGFTIGVCASDSASGLLTLLGDLKGEDFGGFRLERVVVVASGCPFPVLEALRSTSRADPTMQVFEEESRRGKAEAINKIVTSSAGSYLVLVNGDARPEPGSIRRLLSLAASDDRIGCASGCPTFIPEGGLTAGVLQLMWSVHNTSSLELNHMGLSNHASDEMIVVRRDALPTLPADQVNDGAYIAGKLRAEGFKIAFSREAKVWIEVPGNPYDLIQQRRRILYGHRQVWQELGKAPVTVESLLLTKPTLAFKLIADTIAARPSLLAVLPVAAVTETLAMLMSIADRKSPNVHAVWRRFER